MEFVGRQDPIRKLQRWLNGEGNSHPLSIMSISGPGGVGKTWLFERSREGADLDRRNYLVLSVSGSDRPRTLGRVICEDLLDSCTQLDQTRKAYFNQTRANLAGLRWIDQQAQREAEAAADSPELLDAVRRVFKVGAGVTSGLPILRKVLDLSKVSDDHIEAAVGLIEKASATVGAPEWRPLGGILPDLLAKGRRNRLRTELAATLADGLITDLSAILRSARKGDKGKALPRKVHGCDRLLLVIDDFESSAEVLNDFLCEHLVPRLEVADFETTMVVLGRDRLVDTKAMWRQRYERYLDGEIRLDAFNREEGERYVRGRGIVQEEVVRRIVDETAGFPYLLAMEVDAELDGGRSALALKGFLDRTTRWMTPVQKEWLTRLCFLEEINEETVAAVLPKENAREVLDWFKKEASVRSPSSECWAVLPIVRSRVLSYVKVDSPRRFSEVQLLAADAMGGSGVAQGGRG